MIALILAGQYRSASGIDQKQSHCRILAGRPDDRVIDVPISKPIADDYEATVRLRQIRSGILALGVVIEP
jgi:hypothetical protein